MSEKEKTAPIKSPMTKEGSLGVLALGAVGVTAWRNFKNKNEQPKQK